MNHQGLPVLPIYRNTIENHQIGYRMLSHKRKIDSLNRTKKNKHNESLQTYKMLFEQNPKKNYMLETKYTQIERENRLLFEKISKISKKKSNEHRAQDRMRSLNLTLRKKQIQQIQNQNVKMFGRIQRSKPSINFKQTNKQYAKIRKIASQKSHIEKYRLHDWY